MNKTLERNKELLRDTKAFRHKKEARYRSAERTQWRLRLASKEMIGDILRGRLAARGKSAWLRIIITAFFLIVLLASLSFLFFLIAE